MNPAWRTRGVAAAVLAAITFVIMLFAGGRGGSGAPGLVIAFVALTVLALVCLAVAHRKGN